MNDILILCKNGPLKNGWEYSTGLVLIVVTSHDQVEKMLWCWEINLYLSVMVSTFTLLLIIYCRKKKQKNPQN